MALQTDNVYSLKQHKQIMRVVHCYRTYLPDPPGGLQEAIRQICYGTRQFGVKNTVFCLSPHPKPNEINRPECRVIRCRSWLSPASCDLGGLDSFIKFSKIARESDILHYQFPWPFADVLHTIVRPQNPSVLTYHSDIVRQRWLGTAYSPLMWKMLSGMRFIVATSPAYLRTSPVLSHPVVRNRVRVIPFGIDESSYPSDGDYSIFERLGIDEVEPYFLFIGVLRYYKGLHTLMQAAARVDARVIVAGSGPEMPGLKDLAMRHGAKNIIFAGQISDSEKVSLLKNCRSLILPSHLRSEAFGMTLVEAAMFGRPLISCEIGSGTSYVNADEETGFVIPPEDSAAMARAMNSLLADDVLTRTLGKGARERYEQLFSGPALGRAYADLYRDALQ